MQKLVREMTENIYIFVIIAGSLIIDFAALILFCIFLSKTASLFYSVILPYILFLGVPFILFDDPKKAIDIFEYPTLLRLYASAGVSIVNIGFSMIFWKIRGRRGA